jgi:hypothetical protein
MNAFTLFTDNVLARYTHFELLRGEMRMQQTIHFLLGLTLLGTSKHAA